MEPGSDPPYPNPIAGSRARWHAALCIPLSLLGMLALLVAGARADEVATLRVSTASSATTRPLATGSSVVAAALGDGGEGDREVSVVRAGDAAESVIVELREAPLALRAQARSVRAAQAAGSLIAAEHRRVVEEIVRLEGGGLLARGAATGPVRREFQMAFNGIAASLTRPRKPRSGSIST